MEGKIKEIDGRVEYDPAPGEYVTTAIENGLAASEKLGKRVWVIHNARRYEIDAANIAGTIFAAFLRGAAFQEEHGHA